MMMKAKLSRLAAISGLVLSASVAQAEVVKIAVVSPFTGPVTQYGHMTRDGVLTAIEKINAEGGINGNTFEMVIVDDACEPKQGPIAANVVVNQQIGFVIGPFCSGAIMGAAPIFNEQGVVMITNGGTSPTVTAGKNYETVFRSIGRDDQQAPVAAKYVMAKVKPSKIAVLHDKQTYGQGVATYTRDNLKQLGGNIVIFEGINAGESDYSSVITKMKSAGVDFVFYGGLYPELGLLLRQAREQGLKAQFMSAEGAVGTDLNAVAGNAAEGLLVTLSPDFSLKPENAAITKLFQEKGRDPSGTFQMTAYAGVQSIAAGIKATNSTNPIKVAKWLHGNKVDSVVGQLSWEPSGDLTSFDFQVFTWHKDATRTLMQ